MFNSIEYLNSGNKLQRSAYKSIVSLGIMDDFKEYTPILCGTVPINIAIHSSDLDIIMDVSNLQVFEDKLIKYYGRESNFSVKKKTIRGVPVIKANFTHEGFEFELFGQNQPVKRQYAYLHMVIESNIIKNNPMIRESVIKYKEQGYKTEPAFCKVLGIKGDPYDKLIEYGKEKGMI